MLLFVDSPKMMKNGKRREKKREIKSNTLEQKPTKRFTTWNIHNMNWYLCKAVRL